MVEHRLCRRGERHAGEYIELASVASAWRTGYRQGSLTSFSVYRTLQSGRVIVSAQEYRSYWNNSPP